MSGSTNDLSPADIPSPSPVWLVTGASKGIGKDIALAAAASGAHVIAGSRHPDSVTAWSETSDDASQITTTELDVTSEASVHKVIEDIAATHGRLDVVVNNAGYLLYGGVEELTDAEVRRSFDVNVFGLLNVTRQALKIMRSQRFGHVINMSSISADITSPATGLYSATKAAVLKFSEALADEGKELNIHTTAVCPGGIRTDFLDPSSAQRADNVIDDYTEVHTVETQLSEGNHRQGGDPAKVADAIVALATMEAPPSRLYLGRDALQAIDKKTGEIRDSIEQHRHLSESISSR